MILLVIIIVVELGVIIHSLSSKFVPVMDMDLVKKNKKLSGELEHIKSNKDNQKKQYKANVKKYKQSISDLKKENKRLRENNGSDDYKNRINCLNKLLCEKENEIKELKEQLQKKEED